MAASARFRRSHRAAPLAPISELLVKLVRREDLNDDEAIAMADAILGGKVTQAQAGALILALHIKGETTEELAAFVRALRIHITPLTVLKTPLMDFCGTGGDDHGTFNISTATSFVVAGSGLPVTKLVQGTVSSRSGSAECIKELGVSCATSEREIRDVLDETGMAFVTPPWTHPALGRVSALRHELGVPTFLDLLPLFVHPVNVTHRLIGVANPRHLEPVARVSSELGHARVLALHGLGLDEVTLEGETRCYEASDRAVRGLKIDPLALGFSYASIGTLKGGTPAENARLLERILLDEERSPKRDIVILNAAVAIWVSGKARFLGEGVQFALSTLASGKAHAKLRALREYYGSRRKS